VSRDETVDEAQLRLRHRALFEKRHDQALRCMAFQKRSRLAISAGLKWQ
jgi:hypothetical protein